MLMAMPEILRVGPWSLRALGFTFGTADRAVRLLAWSEAVQGQAVRMLRVGEKQIIAANECQRAVRMRNGGTGSTIEAGGRHLFEIGPPAIDLATADARLTGTGHAVLKGAVGVWLVPALCDLAVHRKLGVVAAYAATPDEILPDGFARSGWIIGYPAGDAHPFLSRRLEAGAPDLQTILRQTPLELSDGVTQAIGDHLAAASRSDAGYLGITVLPCAGNGAATDLETIDYAARLAHAYRHGVEVEKVDCDHLYEIERRTWAPTSERSRSQAGYGKYNDGSTNSSAPIGA
ncbi:MAG: hypothetical protein FJX35_07455 [Alphaproteobacteria bacterium]|nr:hypothetical protein [Alphaproteobacteria bacterium]